MTVARRLTALEQALPTKEATLLWMEDAFAYGSLPAYARAIIDEPDEVAPYLRVARQAQAAAREASKGQPREVLDQAVDRATREALLLVSLVLQMNVVAYDFNEIEGLRASAMSFQLRVLMLDQEIAELDRRLGAKNRPEHPSMWHTCLAICRRQVDVVAHEDAAHRELERRYFNGRPALFPELAERWERLLDLTERVGKLAADVPRAYVVESGETVDLPPPPTADERVAGLLDRARVTAFDLLGDRHRALAVMGRLLGD